MFLDISGIYILFDLNSSVIVDYIGRIITI